MSPTEIPAPSDDAPHILLVDDDRRIRQLLSRVLQREGYRVTVANSAEDAGARIRGLQFDLIILDVMMPGENGYQFAARLRADNAPIAEAPILMLTARAEIEDRIQGLEAGVDDYLAKPYDVRELTLRVAALLRRMTRTSAPASSNPARFGEFCFDPDRGELKRGDEIIRITERERDMLRILSEKPGETVSREALGGGEAANERTVDVQVNRLRRKIEEDPANPLLLQTVRGIGYRLAAER
ncbi:two component transcriptional regulator, winged helix family [Rhodoblastus acidophilus]|uniref:Two component transcriptional regulator, winged helix family n=1 Tax=Rhodoblastus acidophilus TaxID=1074 RepID=A0A212S5P5_RHOAC|nr:response regulator transcription factor [Rhodoblastus acidophilus]MCW2318463.1 two-component system phosphate regulon response regulator OmpR [Rhodoblastus acidophilus]PPQ37492.1 DNA-binding response regulator [Rhodoblastus acidophilus]RAI19690.1 DNA-binding response regulator [Rhodoblastus acidophilus]SNB80534.1 two component transcriptional regulator, winged helix family [Rhodoblastus acidophilus]